MKKFQQHVRLEGSQRKPPSDARTRTINPEEVIEVTVRLKGKAPIPDLKAGKKNALSPFTREKFAIQYGADQPDIILLESFAHEFGLTITQISLPRRTVVLRGPIRQMAQAFRVRLAHYRRPDGTEYRGRSGHIYIPKELVEKITGVFGLDNRPVATPKFKVGKSVDGHFAPQAQGTSYNPTDIALFYGFPKGSGTGQGIALVELGGGYETADLATYFSGLGVNQPSVTAISVDGGTPDSADGEVMLDIEVVGAVSLAAAIHVYFAPNTDQGVAWENLIMQNYGSVSRLSLKEA